MKTTKKQFLADVMHEIEMLKKYSTKKEKARLDIDIFDPAFPNKCIYGLLAMGCGSERSRELMGLSCKRVMHLETGVRQVENADFKEIQDMINGEYAEQTWKRGWFGRTYKYLSVLEAYINLKGAKNKEIISYIKGETDTLKL